MGIPLMLVAVTSLVIDAADAAPRYDVKPTCRAAIAMISSGAEGRTVESCLQGEEGARKGSQGDRVNA
jgi:hypothetical protein